jgi:hypothetical protein
VSETAPNPEKQAAYEAHRLRRCLARGALRDRLLEEGANDLASRLDRCGQPIPLTCTGCGRESAPLSRCDRKWCPSCAPKLATLMVEKYTTLTAQMKWPLFVTWTTLNYDEPDVRPLRKAWGKLRRLRWFRRLVPGGVAAFECTEHGKGYHWHIHALLDCKWIAPTVPHPPYGCSKAQWHRSAVAACTETAEQWSLCTGRESSIDVRRVWGRDGGDVRRATAEVLKYCVSAETLLGMNGPVAPFIRLLQGTRLITSFGTMFGKAPKPPKRPPLMCECGCSDRMPTAYVPTTRKRVPRMVVFKHSPAY